MADETNEPTRCSFCGCSDQEVGELLFGNGTGEIVRICSNCSKETERIFEPKRRRARPISEKLWSLPKPEEIVRHLDQQIISQTSAKRKLAVAVTNHAKRLLDAEIRASMSESDRKESYLGEVVIEKSNILLIGPTGSGKTAMVKALAEKLHVPLVIGDATTLTESGYAGEDVESLLYRLLETALWDISEAERGIVFIDEIDKLRMTTSRSGNRDINGAGVQQSLLKMIEGHKCTVPVGSRKQPADTGLLMDTSNILFICGGAFAGLDQIIADRLGRSAIGFRTKQPSSDCPNFLSQVLPQDLEEFGLIPELVGRLPVIATLDELSEADLETILVSPRSSLVKQFRKLAFLGQAELGFHNEAVRAMAQIAKERGTGARGLRSVLERVMEPILFNMLMASRHNVTVDDVYKAFPNAKRNPPLARYIRPSRRRVAANG